MPAEKLEDIEINLLLEAIYQRYGHDFRHYAPSSIKRRLENYLPKTGCRSVSELIPRVLHDRDFFQKMLQAFSITVTEMFRDPFVYRALRKKVVQVLRTYPSIKVWVAGCATGEEAYSLAILLKEEGLYKKATLFATDFNDEALAAAKEGIYPIERIKKFTQNYLKSGGTQPFSSYYFARYDAMLIDKGLKKNITFANHNLVTDSVFGEMHLILCRNVMIYFDRNLQDRALGLFEESLVHRGFLCIGPQETIQFSAVQNCFDAVDERARIFRKKVFSDSREEGIQK